MAHAQWLHSLWRRKGEEQGKQDDDDGDDGDDGDGDDDRASNSHVLGKYPATKLYVQPSFSPFLSAFASGF